MMPFWLVNTSYFLMDEYYSIVWVYILYLAICPVDRLLGYFHLLAAINSAAMNICIQGLDFQLSWVYT